MRWSQIKINKLNKTKKERSHETTKQKDAGIWIYPDNGQSDIGDR